MDNDFSFLYLLDDFCSFWLYLCNNRHLFLFCPLNMTAYTASNFFQRTLKCRVFILTDHDVWIYVSAETLYQG